jgi:hypothetical protein
MYLLPYGPEPFLRSRQLCSHTRISQRFMGPEGSIPRSQEPSTGPYPELYQSNPHHIFLSYISKIHFNIVDPPTSWPSQWSLSFWLSHQYPICSSLLPHSRNPVVKSGATLSLSLFLKLTCGYYFHLPEVYPIIVVCNTKCFITDS